MQILFLILLYSFIVIFSYFLSLVFIASFLCSRDNILDKKISNVIKYLMFVPFLNILLAFLKLLVRFNVFIKEDIEEFNNKNN
jgi:hypothetical protein|uniref:Uncharacterized protein n=1 Tax=Podoviridae sp. ctQyH19 TaxID=2825249 RepID=A0A8S5UQR1_9CAUD|nr:MAG TPA: hypothetical protein [Podoviridae sp. ctQyH19]